MIIEGKNDEGVRAEGRLRDFVLCDSVTELARPLPAFLEDMKKKKTLEEDYVFKPNKYV